MKPRKPLTAMSDVDADGTAERYAALLARVTGQMQASKKRGYDLLRLGPGRRVLDVGAGNGEDAVALAPRVAPGGVVVALDKSLDLLKQAHERVAANGADVELLEGDAHALDLPSESFDACRAERVFQHLERPAVALAEMCRVTRPGGRVVVSDADWDNLSIDASDREVTRAVVRRRSDATPQGWIARQLPRLFRDAGLEVTHVEGVTFTCMDHDLAVQIFELDSIAEHVVAAGELPRERVDAWRDELAARGRDDRFFVASTGFMVAGVR